MRDLYRLSWHLEWLGGRDVGVVEGWLRSQGIPDDVVGVVIQVVEVVVLVGHGVDWFVFHHVALVVCPALICVFLGVGQMEGDLLRGKLQFVAVVVPNSVDGFLFETAVDIHVGTGDDAFLDLAQQKGVQFAYPVLPEYLQFVDLVLTLLGQQEHEEIGVDVDDGVMDGGCEGGYFDEFVDDVDVLHDCAFALVLEHGLLEEAHQPLFETGEGET
jgi:hypothetical protein